MPNGAVPGDGIAFGAPGIPPRWTSSSKEGIGTAYSTSSRIWFTVSHGILNEVYYPTIDRPQIRDLQFLITDGKTFFQEEKRDLKWEIDYIERHALGFRIVSSDPQGRYRLIKEVVSDPHQPCVLIHARLEPAPGWRGRLQIYALLAPHLDVGGWGNSARRFQTAGRQILVAWKNTTYLALGADVGFSRASCGYVGASDGWRDLSDNYAMDWQFDRAENGNTAVTGQIALPRNNEFTLALAFGDSLHMAVSILTQSLSVRFEEHRDRFIEQWHRACCQIHDLEKVSCDGGHLYRVSNSLLLAHEDKTYAGAIIASASIPWGEAKGDEDLGGYHLVWTRDMVNSATGLLACDDAVTPRRALVYLACTQRADGGFPQNFWIDGTPYWSGMQLDEVAFPVILAWRLWKADALGDFDPYPMVKAAAGFLTRMGPATQQERWEEDSGYSPSTLAACIAGLICAADFARARGAEPLVEMLGYANPADAVHLTAPDVEAAGSARCMQLAIERSGLQPEQISYINAHATSTLAGDLAETQAIKLVFGPAAYRTPVSSTKSMTGHALGGAGALETVICVQALRDGWIPPTINLEHPDPQCDLDFVPNQARPARLSAVLSNSFGFGGHNVSLVLGAYFR